MCTKPVIDCSSLPKIPHQNLRILQHEQSRSFLWNPDNIILQKSIFSTVYEMRKALAARPLVNATVLDYLLEHPELIPDEWKNIIVLFLGTIYESEINAQQFFRFLYWDEFRWYSDFQWTHIKLPSSVYRVAIFVD